MLHHTRYQVDVVFSVHVACAKIFYLILVCACRYEVRVSVDTTHLVGVPLHMWTGSCNVFASLFRLQNQYLVYEVDNMTTKTKHSVHVYRNVGPTPGSRVFLRFQKLILTF